MNKKVKKKTDPTGDLLRAELVEVPSEKFSDRLLHASMTSYRVSYSRKYQKEERLGKAIIGILIFFNLMMLVKLSPFGNDQAMVNVVIVSVILVSGYCIRYLAHMNKREMLR